MKRTSILTFCFLVLLSCKKKEALTFTTVSYTSETCEGCPSVAINIPLALQKTKLGNAINNSVREEVIFLLSYDDTLEVSSVEDAMKSFTNGYEELKELYPDETPGWEAKIDASVSYEDQDVITIQLESFLFTGGAHGYGAKHFLNFDAKKGTELENWQLFKDSQEFEKFAESKFRAQEKIPNNLPINSTGFMFEGDAFYLPENIGFTREGLQLLYNQYEVASYADGPIEITLPYNAVQRYLLQRKKS
jgi:hypothetical protein